MERSFRVLKTIPILFVVSFSVCPQLIFARVALAPSQDPPPLNEAGQSYPASRFGAGPTQVEGGGTHRATAMELEESAGDIEGSGRGPAGLEFTSQKGQVQATPVIQGIMPTSPANLNPKPSTASRTGTQEVALIAGDLGFFPRTVFVTRDIPVRMFVTGASKKPLCIMMDSFQVRKQVRSQRIEEISFIPTTPGQYRFYCPVNGMEGTLFVKEIGTVANVVPGSKVSGE
jgi:plastocyanin